MTRRYEVQVEGELSEPMLRYLTWSHCVIPEVTRLQVRVTPTELEHVLRAILDEGLTVEGVHQVRPPMATGLSRGAADAPPG